jgi:predicted Zn-ribbon and HTH transcriptional regulator
MRRIYGEELRRRNIRPAFCYKCNYNLAGFDVTHCPKCKTQLLSDLPDKERV